MNNFMSGPKCWLLEIHRRTNSTSRQPCFVQLNFSLTSLFPIFIYIQNIHIYLHFAQLNSVRTLSSHFIFVLPWTRFLPTYSIHHSTYARHSINPHIRYTTALMPGTVYCYKNNIPTIREVLHFHVMRIYGISVCWCFTKQIFLSSTLNSFSPW